MASELQKRHGDVRSGQKKCVFSFYLKVLLQSITMQFSSDYVIYL